MRSQEKWNKLSYYKITLQNIKSHSNDKHYSGIKKINNAM